MKKLLLLAFVATAFITSCSKDVKAPAKTANASNAKLSTTNTTSTTGSQTTAGSQTGHACGSGSGNTGH